MSLNDDEIAIVKGMLDRGDKQHDIAAYFGINAGRVSEISSGFTGAEIEAAPEHMLPPPGPVMAGRSAAAAFRALQSARSEIDRVIREISDREGWSDRIRGENEGEHHG